MKKYTVQVVVSYVQVIEVEANTQEDAEIKAFESFDLAQAYQGEGDAWTVGVNEGEEA